MKRINLDVPLKLHARLKVEAFRRGMLFRELLLERLKGSKSRKRSKARKSVGGVV